MKKQEKDLESYRTSEKAKEAWKKSIGSLTDVIPHGEDGESLTEYIERKRKEESE